MAYEVLKGTYFDDLSTRRDLRNNPETGTKKILDNKSGMILNATGLHDLRDRYVFADKSFGLPKDIFKEEKNDELEKSTNKALLISSLFTAGVTGILALASKIALSKAKSKLKIPKLENLNDLKKIVEDIALNKNLKNAVSDSTKEIPDIGRNMNLCKEEFFVAYMTCRTPDVKNILSALAFFAFSSTGFILKNFVDGAKEIWVRKKEADIDRDLREDLIDAETKAFKGKNDIIAGMINSVLEKVEKASNKETFKGGNFTARNKQKNKSDVYQPLIIAGTIILSVLCGASAFKNIKKLNSFIGETHEKLMKGIVELIEKQIPKSLTEENKKTITDILKIYGFKTEYATNILKKIGADSKIAEETLRHLRKNNGIFTETPQTLGGTVGKLQYYSYNDDAKGHFYNWIMNSDSKPLGIISNAITAVTILGYLGTSIVEAVKNVEVKKANAKTELNLQKKLVNVELKNFYSKKNSIIQPLVQKLDEAIKTNDTHKTQLLTEHILSEIKNGPPFVYA